MKPINFNTWQCYYMNNDGQKIVFATGLSYRAAIKLCGQYVTLYNISAEYE